MVLDETESVLASGTLQRLFIRLRAGLSGLRGLSPKSRFDVPSFFFFVCFLAQAVYFLFFTPRYVPYDEFYHVELTRVFHGAGWGLPELTPDVAKYGPATRQPWLYYYLAGRFLALKPHAVPTWYWLRALSLLLVTGSLLVSWKLYRMIARVPSSVFLAWAIQLNLLMFVYFASVVSYDHLLNLLAVSGYWCFFRYLRELKAVHLWGYLFFCLVGCFTKLTFLPIAVVATALLFGLGWWRSRGKRPGGYLSMVCGDTLEWIKARKAVGPLLVAGTLCSGAAVAGLYGGNLVRYGRLVPECDQVYTPAQCQANGVYARDVVYRERPPSVESPSFARYLVNWSEFMTWRTLGIFGQERFLPPRWVARFLSVGILILLLAALLRPRLLLRWEPAVALLIGGVYALVLAAWTMRGYVRTGIEGFVVHGRHLFPVLPLLLPAFAHYGLGPYRGRRRAVVLVLLVTVFVALGFPYFAVRHERWQCPRAHPHLCNI